MVATATKDKIVEELGVLSDKISTVVRTTAIGLLAVGWGFIVAPSERFRLHPAAVLAIIVCALLGLMLDWLQYLAGYVNTYSRFRQMERDPNLRGWDPSDWSYGLRDALWKAKQLIVALGVVILVASAVPSIIHFLVQ